MDAWLRLAAQLPLLHLRQVGGVLRGCRADGPPQAGGAAVGPAGPQGVAWLAHGLIAPPTLPPPALPVQVPGTLPLALRRDGGGACVPGPGIHGRRSGTPLTRELRWDPISGRELDFTTLRSFFTDGPFSTAWPVPEDRIIAHWEQCAPARHAPSQAAPDSACANPSTGLVCVGVQTFPEELGLHPAGLSLDDVRIDLLQLEWWTQDAFQEYQASLDRPQDIIDHLWDQMATGGQFRAWAAAGRPASGTSLCPEHPLDVAGGDGEASAPLLLSADVCSAPSAAVAATAFLPRGIRAPDIAACAEDFAYGGRVLVVGEPARAVVVGGILRLFLVVGPAGPRPYSAFLLRQWHECSDEALAELLPFLADLPTDLVPTNSGRRVPRWGPVIHLDAVCGILEHAPRAATILRNLCYRGAYDAAVASGNSTPLDDVRAAWPFPEI